MAGESMNDRRFITCPNCFTINIVDDSMKPGRCIAHGTREACGTDLAELQRRMGP